MLFGKGASSMEGERQIPQGVMITVTVSLDGEIIFRVQS
jgi:hypothetical protein